METQGDSAVSFTRISRAVLMQQPLEQPYVKTGGARIGWMNVTWPFAELWTAPERLTITAQFLGKYAFTPEQVCAVEPYVMVPILGWGIRVRHCMPDYPQRIIFWSLVSPNRVLRGIGASGFIPTGVGSTVDAAGWAMPLQWPVLAAVVVLWNVLLLSDFAHPGRTSGHPEWFACAALFLVFVISLGTLTSTSLQRLMLKPNRSVSEVRPFLRVLAFISGLLLLLSILAATSASKGPPNPRAALDAGIALCSQAGRPRPGASEHERWT